MYAETPCSEVALGAVVKALLSGLVSWHTLLFRCMCAALRQARSPFAGRMWRTSIVVLVFAAKLRTGDLETARGPVDVRYRQGKDVVLTSGRVLAEYGGSVGGSWDWV
jgi:hypothetical protein